MTCVHVRRDTEMWTHQRENGYVKTEAEMGMSQLQTKNMTRIASEPPDARRGKEGAFPRAFRGRSALPTT